MQYSDIVLHACQLAQTALHHYQDGHTINSIRTLRILQHMLARYNLRTPTPLTKKERNYGNEQPEPE